MTPKSKLILILTATALSVGILGPVIAQDRGDSPRIERGERDDAQMMRAKHRGERGDRGDRRERLRGFLETFDTNGDGGLTQEEIDTARAARLAAFDTDGDGSLTIAEFEALWLDAMRERMVDQFQRHDDDGDGQVTAAEFGERFENIVARRDTNDDGVLNADDMRRRAPVE